MAPPLAISQYLKLLNFRAIVFTGSNPILPGGLPMDFWWGLIIGAFAGTCIGMVMIGLLAGSKRQGTNQEFLWDQLHMDQAVIDDEPDKTPRRVHPKPDGIPEPAAHC
jgi:hypothetical protein